jgi:hypothetical protein
MNEWRSMNGVHYDESKNADELIVFVGMSVVCAVWGTWTNTDRTCTGRALAVAVEMMDGNADIIIYMI